MNSPGKYMQVSDTISRAHINHSKPKFAENSLIHCIHFLLSNLMIIETHLKQFQLETKNSSILQTLITYTTHKWSLKCLRPTVTFILYPLQ